MSSNDTPASPSSSPSNDQRKRGLVATKAASSGSPPPPPKRARCGGDDEPWMALFDVPEPRPVFQWILPPNTYNPAAGSRDAVGLLLNDQFIDKSAALHQLLSEYYNKEVGDFDSASLLLAFPRRFAKTTLLNFIEAVFSPLPFVSTNRNVDSKRVKTKIAALEKGVELLALGTRPVFYLDMQSVCSTADLNLEIEAGFKYAGLSADEAALLRDNSKLAPAQRVRLGLDLLNQKFKKRTGKELNTIMLVDEYDKPFRTRDADESFLAALVGIYGLGKGQISGLSLTVLCGLTRMVGAGLSSINNLVDVSQETKYHGICGISAAELVRSVGTQLDALTKKKYDGKTFQTILETIFRRDWNVFRFGLTEEKGLVNPETPSGSLFSPLDMWGLIVSLSAQKSPQVPSQWTKTMFAEFEFTNFAKKYHTKRGFLELSENLVGGWEERDAVEQCMSRKEYLELDSDLNVKKTLFELGLLSVRAVEETKVLLGSPNWIVTRNAMQLLIKKTEFGHATPEDKAIFFLSEEGLRRTLSAVADTIATRYGEFCRHDAMREYPFQDDLYFRLLHQFPPVKNRTYDVFKEVYANRTKESEKNSGYNDIAVELRDDGGNGRVTIMELKLEKHKVILDRNAVLKAHARNLDEAEKQVKTYVWRKTAKSVVTQRIAISGVWFPSEDGKYNLDTELKYLDA